MNEGHFVVNIETSKAVTSVDLLKEKIKEADAMLLQTNKSLQKLHDNEPRPKASTVALANCALSIVIVALQLLNMYLVISR